MENYMRRMDFMPHMNKQMASFFLTTRCNLRCTYCYNREKRSQFVEQDLPLDIARAGIDYYFANSTSRHIRFYGPGEPTQAFPLMKEIVTYARQIATSSLTVELQTNGCFGNDVRAWILDNLNIVWISFDGEPDIQNHNRPCANGKPSAPIIERNVMWLIAKKNNRNLMVGARVTITEENVSRQRQIVDYFKSLGIKYIWTDPVFPSVGDTPVCEDPIRAESYHFDMDLYADTYIDAYKYAQQYNIFYGSFLTCNFDGVCNRHCRACTPVPHFTTDGYISACDLVTFGNSPKHMDCFVYGKWNKEKKQFDIDETKVNALKARTIENMPHCINCDVREHCGGYCLGEVQNETGKLTGQKPHTCRAIQKIAKSIGYADNEYLYLHP